MQIKHQIKFFMYQISYVLLVILLFYLDYSMAVIILLKNRYHPSIADVKYKLRKLFQKVFLYYVLKALTLKPLTH